MNIDDIEEISSYNKNSYSDYGDEWNMSSNYSNYPNMYENEMPGVLTGIGRSEQNDYITGTSKASTLKTMATYYTYVISTRYTTQII